MDNFESVNDKDVEQVAGGANNYEFAGIPCPICGKPLRKWQTNPNRLDCVNAHICDANGKYIKSLIF